MGNWVGCVNIDSTHLGGPSLTSSVKLSLGSSLPSNAKGETVASRTALGDPSSKLSVVVLIRLVLPGLLSVNANILDRFVHCSRRSGTSAAQ